MNGKADEYKSKRLPPLLPKTSRAAQYHEQVFLSTLRDRLEQLNRLPLTVFVCGPSEESNPVTKKKLDTVNELRSLGHNALIGEEIVQQLKDKDKSDGQSDLDQHRKTLSELVKQKVKMASEYGISLENMEFELIPSRVIASAQAIDKRYDRLVTAQLSAGQAILENDYSSFDLVDNQDELLQGLKGPILVEAKGNLGFVEICDEDFDNGQKHTEESLAIAESPVRLVNLAYILAHSEEQPTQIQAEARARRAIDLISKDPTSTAWLLKVFLVPNEKLDVDNRNQDLIENPVVDSVARCTLASLLALRNEFKEALRCCELAELRSRDRAFPLRVRARILLMRGEIESAHEALKKATEVDSSDIWAKIEFDRLRYSDTQHNEH